MAAISSDAAAVEFLPAAYGPVAAINVGDAAAETVNTLGNLT